VFLRIDALELCKAGACDTVDCLAGRVGYKMQMYANGSISRLGIKLDDWGITGGIRQRRDSIRPYRNFIRVLP